MPRKIPRKLKAFYKSVKITSDQARALWNSCRHNPNVFISPFAVPEASESLAPKDLPGTLPLGKPWHGENHYLPIENLKGQMGENIAAQVRGVQKFFRSSGTTQADRAKSPFTEDGLNLYRAVSVRSFYDMLHNLQPVPPLRLRAVSLIPTTAEWPDSSLAQMIEWIGELWGKVHYIKPHELPAFVKSYRRRPYFVFGTALHWMELLEEGRRLRMPAGSVAIETGGLKASGLQLTREDLYLMLSTALKIPESSIVSEYGMSEMASQAYDWQVTKFGSRKAQRSFRFPNWVQVGTMRGQGLVDDGSQGALVIRDPMRVDLPYALRTQDLASVDRSSSFVLEGRVPYAVLKGCSMLATDIVSSEAKKPPLHVSSPEITWALDYSEVTERAKTCMTLLDRLLSEPLALTQLTEELGSQNAAQSALEDLRRSIPKTLDAWTEASRVALGLKTSGEGCKIPQSWLIIPPANHSFAALYPILMGMTAGLQLTVREPRPQQLGFFHNFLDICSHGGGGKGPKILPNTFRFGNSSQMTPHFDAVLVYGSDATVEQIRSVVSAPLKGFGTSICVSLSPADLDAAQAKNLIKDAFSLGQKGCLSSRGVLLVHDGSNLSESSPVVQRASQLLTGAFENFWQSEIPWKDQVALDHELVHLNRVGVKSARQSPATPLFPLYFPQREIDLRPFLSERAFVLPLIFLNKRQLQESKHAIANVRELRTMSIDESQADSAVSFLSSKVRTTPLGDANILIWDGMFESQNIFVISTN